MITSYNKVIERLKEIKQEDVESFIILVSTNKETEDKKGYEGINAIEGKELDLVNLISNINEELLKTFIFLKVLKGVSKDE